MTNLPVSKAEIKLYKILRFHILLQFVSVFPSDKVHKAVEQFVYKTMKENFTMTLFCPSILQRLLKQSMLLTEIEGPVISAKGITRQLYNQALCNFKVYWRLLPLSFADVCHKRNKSQLFLKNRQKWKTTDTSKRRTVYHLF